MVTLMCSLVYKGKMKRHEIFGTTFVLVLLAISRGTDGQCTVSLTFPLEPGLRTIPISKATTSVTVAVSLECTGSLPMNDIATSIMYTDPAGVVTSASPVTVNVFAGTTSSETNIDIMDTTGGSDTTITLTATLSTSATGVSVDPALEDLIFSLQNLAEISFDTTKTYQGQLGDTISVCLIRTGAQQEITVDVDALSGNSFLNTPVPATFPANTDTTSVDITVTGDALADMAITLVFNSLPGGTIVTRDQNSRAVVTVLRPVTLSTAVSTFRLSAISSVVDFTVIASRTYPSDITINLSYTGDFTILVNQPSTITLASGTDRVSTNIMINPTSSHTFAISMTSANNGAIISNTQSFTTYTIDALNILISVSQTEYTAEEGSMITVTFTTSEPAPTEIEIDLFTPDASHAQELGPLPNAIIRAGATSGVVGIQILQDSLLEGTERVMVSFNSLTDGAGFTPGDDAITITITDSAGGGPIIPPNDDNTNTNTNTNNNNNNGNGLSGGAIAGIAIGSACFLILVLGVAVCCGLFVMSNGCGTTSPYYSGYPGAYRSRYPSYPRGPVIYEVEY
ncbi:hypothetical protein HOLleu_05562 [Holothuria leucospilota]|uniref:Uncharacterized protein n=1 Tax=Holothuria leucospilota TaxID=206669 RepID=A0A9Q1CKV9_HOLLE|nr:hypothetical protein HOLleu_05562 [Holothuria leucospilota]